MLGSLTNRYECLPVLAAVWTTTEAPFRFKNPVATNSEQIQLEPWQVTEGANFGSVSDPQIGTRTDAYEGDVRLGVLYGNPNDWNVGELEVDVIYVPTPTMTINGECIPMRYDFPLVQGDDYLTTGPRPFVFALDFDEVPMVGATANFRANLEQHTFVGQASVAVDVDGNATLVVGFNRTDLVTRSGTYDYDCEIVLATGEVLTVLWGKLPLKHSQTTLVP